MTNTLLHLCFLANLESAHTQRWLRFYIQRGHRVSVITFLPGPDIGAEVHVMRPRVVSKARYLVAAPAVRQLVRSLSPDVVHAHHATSYGLLGALAGHHPLVITAHGSDLLVTPKRSRLLRRTTAWALEQADLVTAASSDLGSAVIQLTDGRVRPLVFQYGLDLQEWRYRERLPTSGVTRIISTRVLGPLYDVETLIRAVPIVQNLAGSVEVVICGDGPLRPSLERLARELGVSSAVRFLGALPAQALGEQLRDADIYVSTSLSDGLSMSLLEGMAIGLYPVVSDIPANRSLITDGGNGSLFRAGDPKHLSFAIVEAMSRPDSRLRAQRQNRAYIEEHADRQTILASFERCYYALAGGETRCGASADARG